MRWQALENGRWWHHLINGGVSSLFQFLQDWAVCTSSRYVLQMAIERRGWPCPLAGRLCSLGAAVCQSAWEKIWLLVIPWADTWESCPPSYPFFRPSTSRVWEGGNEETRTWGKCEKRVELSQSMRYSPRWIPPVRKGVDFWITAWITLFLCRE